MGYVPRPFCQQNLRTASRASGGSSYGWTSSRHNLERQPTEGAAREHERLRGQKRRKKDKRKREREASEKKASEAKSFPEYWQQQRQNLSDQQPAVRTTRVRRSGLGVRNAQYVEGSANRPRTRKTKSA